jgi:hypothetical protein
MITDEKQQMQEIYNKVAAHLIAQGVRSVGFNCYMLPSCRYRGDKGLMCAVGCLISDKHYFSTLEGVNVMGKNVIRALENSLGTTLAVCTLDLLQKLQLIHDKELCDTWKVHLETVGRKHHLNTDVLNSVHPL